MNHKASWMLKWSIGNFWMLIPCFQGTLQVYQKAFTRANYDLLSFIQLRVWSRWWIRKERRHALVTQNCSFGDPSHIWTINFIANGAQSSQLKYVRLIFWELPFAWCNDGFLRHPHFWCLVTKATFWQRMHVIWYPWLNFYGQAGHFVGESLGSRHEGPWTSAFVWAHTLYQALTW